MNKILIVGNDKIGRRLIHKLEYRKYEGYIYLDKSPKIRRIIKLLIRRRVPIRHLVNMFLAMFFRQDFVIGYYPAIYSNDDLLQLIKKLSPKTIFFFRAGLVINKSVIDTGVELINVHCAELPQYSGLGAIARAIEDKAYHQCATMHRIIKKIDAGEILATMPYMMKKENSYRENEDIAYDAGIRLILIELGLNVDEWGNIDDKIKRD